MARIHAETHVEAPPRQVWDVLVDWEGQARWMRAARRVEVVGSQRAGVGVRLRCPTTLAGVTFTDELVTTEWDDPNLLGVRHDGWFIRGVATFELTATPHGTRVLWQEEIDPPLGPLGEAAATVLVPAVDRLFRADLAALKRICESTSVRP